MAASMTLDLGNTDKLNVFRQELDRLGVRLMIPDINRSDAVFSVERLEGGKAISYALAAVKGVGLDAMKAMAEDRRQNGPYRDLLHYARRLAPQVVTKPQPENIILSGSFHRMRAHTPG